ncbi:MAG TPA: hypothetical protein VHV08_11390 [Pirellulales bacterium]|nr:hypothetical protein [Pirellulales bacterium]
MFIRSLVTFTCFALATGQAVRAASIGINFATDASGGTFDLAASDLVGVLPQQHWNNAHNSDPTLTNLVDDQGTATAASISWNHAPVSTNVPGGTLLDNLLHSAIGCSPFDGIVVSNIPFGEFDLYLYMAAPAPSFAIFKINHGATAADQLSVQGIADASGTASFELATPTHAGNFLFLAGVSGSTLYIGGGGFAPVEGLQIVAAPEPSSCVLAGLALAGLVAWGWKKRLVGPS